MVTVAVPRALARYAADQTHVEVDVGSNATVGAVLDALGQRYPGVRDRTIDEQGALRRHVNVFVNGESVRFNGGLDAPVPDGAEVAILPAVSGG